MLYIIKLSRFCVKLFWHLITLPLLYLLCDSIHHLLTLFCYLSFIESLLLGHSPLSYGPLLTVTGGLVDGDKIEVLPERVERLASRLKVQRYIILYYHAMPPPPLPRYAMPSLTMLCPSTHAMPCYALPRHAIPFYTIP